MKRHLHSNPLPLDSTHFDRVTKLCDLKLGDLFRGIDHEEWKLYAVVFAQARDGTFKAEALLKTGVNTDAYIFATTGESHSDARNSARFRVYSFIEGRFQAAWEIPPFHERDKLDRAEAEKAAALAEHFQARGTRP